MSDLPPGFVADDTPRSPFARLDGLDPSLVSAYSNVSQTFPDLRITSGYRSPRYNASVGGARGSQHMHNRAIDISLAGYSPQEQERIVRAFLADPRVGGVGYYPNSQSIHVDVRPGGRAAWGPNYSRTSLPQTPDWFQRAVAEWQGGGTTGIHPVNNRPILHNPDGSIATEESITVTHPRLNAGRPTNIPSIWGGQRPPFQHGTPEFEDWAVERALATGKTFPTFNSIDEAVAAAKARSNMLGRTQPSRLRSIGPPAEIQANFRPISGQPSTFAPPDMDEIMRSQGTPDPLPYPMMDPPDSMSAVPLPPPRPLAAPVTPVTAEPLPDISSPFAF